MKIDNSYKPNLAQPLGRQATTAQAPSTATDDAVKLSEVANNLHLQGIEKPPINSARIQEIKEAITLGRFKINPEAIADGLIESARDLIATQRKA